MNTKILITLMMAFGVKSLVAQPLNANRGSKKIQLALCLDVSNSMDGLIDQAKAQLWSMVSVLGKAKSNEGPPQIELALYEYGRSSNNPLEAYVKQINPFTGDLDQVSKNLFGLTTNGGAEFCGHAIFRAVSELGWDSIPSTYKVIFIAGNEDFLQGDLHYKKACAKAIKKGVIVNTIYCGERAQGIREHWDLGAECGQGSFTQIDHDAKLVDIATPYDSILFLQNDKLNATYLTYGDKGNESHMKQAEVDKLSYSKNKSSAATRVAVKGKKELYKNSGWDLIDAHDDDSNVIAKIDVKTLPDSLKTKSRIELQEIVKSKKAERGMIQKEIETLNVKRELFIAEEKAKLTAGSKQPTLETEIEKIIKQQASKFNMAIE